MTTATKGTSTYRRMQQLAKTDPDVAARLALFDHRVIEEFYDVQNDPDALHNLADDPQYRQELDRHRRAMDEWMLKTGDPLLETFRQRDDPRALAAYMERVEKEAAERRERKRPRRKVGAENRKSRARR